MYTSFHGEQGDEELGKKHIARLYKVLDVYERILSTQKYIAGDVSTCSLSSNAYDCSPGLDATHRRLHSPIFLTFHTPTCCTPRTTSTLMMLRSAPMSLGKSDRTYLASQYAYQAPVGGGRTSLLALHGRRCWQHEHRRLDIWSGLFRGQCNV